MGVPKFFRYISERYPCLSQLILECDIPEFDNLYLDMNGIIHNCSHPNDYDPHFRITEEKIFKDIFHYIEILFRIIRPQKLFFMAIDGVAPRAKMNQQRGRRFRSAKEAADREKEVVRKGEKLPEADRFDSNCITPGTPFMARLQAQLKYFVSLKVSTDKMWQKVKIILSGHECPGEGEHKIMDYIRFLRSQSDHDPNTRHCLYGLDADLIMLGLCSHEPHFALLREEVKFGSRNQSKKIVTPEDTKFFLLHLSLMREYLEMEFSDLKTTLPFEFDLECIIDDWVLMGFLVGNDFIPNLPELHISSGALPILYKAYREVLPTLDGYLNESGTLNLGRFEAYMKKLGSFDIKQFREKYDDMRYFASKTGDKKDTPEKPPENNVSYRRPLQPFFDSEGEPNENAEVENEPLESYDDQAIQVMMDMEEDEGSDYYDEEDRDKDRLAFFQEFHLHKRNYYQEKLEYEHITPEVLRNQAEGYIIALQWNLNYYYNGICSWSWFYPHHYSPYISDIQNFKDMKIEFDIGRPFLPFEQLLAVLPSLSKNLLPKPFQELMVDVRSPIFDYYPLDFETDLNGKKNDWEAVVLIPFIDENKLLKAMESCYNRLTDEEKERNKHGPMHVYTYTEENLGRYEAPAHFNPIEKNHALDLPCPREDIIVPKEQLRKGLLPGVLLDVFFPGFPTFKHLKYVSSLEPKGVKVFQSPSQGLNMIVKPIKSEDIPPFDALIPSYLNKIIHVSWPYLDEAKVVGISTKEEKCSVEAGQLKRESLNPDQVKTFERGCEALKQELLRSKGIDVGEQIEVILHVRIKEGERFVFHPDNKINLEKKWSNKLQSFPFQVIVKDVETKVADPSSLTLDDIFPVGTSCFVLNERFYGCLGNVSAPSENFLVHIRITEPPEPKPHELVIKPTNVRYYSNAETAHRAKVPSYLVARITGTIFVLDTDDPKDADKCPKVNIGLNLKFSRRNQHLPGFTKRKESNQWLYSDKTIALIQEYAEAFPEVLRFLSNNSDKDNIFKNDLFSLPGQTHMLNVITNWLNSKSELKSERRSCDAELLESDVIINLENQIDSFMRANKRGKYVNIKSKPNCLYQPSSQIEKDYPDPAEFHLLDRVVNVRDNFVVPLGARGTIIGMEKQADQGLTYCDILFDSSFSAATQYHTKKKRVYKLPDRCLLNITYAKRKREREEMKKNHSKVQLMQHNAIPRHQFPPPLMAQKIDMGAPNALPFNSGPRQIMIASGPPGNMSYSNVLADRQKPSPKSVPYRAPDGTEDRRRTPKNNSPAKLKPVETAKAKGQDESDTTMALKKMLRISDLSKEPSTAKTPERAILERNAEEKNDNKGYVIELQELFQKAGKGNPRYEYNHSDGNFRATLHLPGIDVGISSDPAPTKQQAGEKAAFLVLRFLNLVKNFGDKVSPLPTSENVILDLNLQFLRLQSELQDMQRQQNVRDRAPVKAQYAEPDVDGLQTLLLRSQQQQQQQKLQMFLSAQQHGTQVPQQSGVHYQSYPPGMPFQPPPQMAPQRQMTVATNYVYQQNVPAKYPVPPQLYYQNVQNIYYHQPLRANLPPSGSLPPQWFPQMMPPHVVNMPAIQPRTFYPEQLPQNYNQQIDKPPALNYLASNSQAYLATIPNNSNDIKTIAGSPQPKSDPAFCSGRVSKTPKKKRLAANFATKATT